MIRVEITKCHDEEFKTLEINSFQKKYRSMEHLRHRISHSKCSRPEFIDDLAIWRAMVDEDAEIEENIILNGADIFGMLSPRRLELVDYLSTNNVSSIKDLGEKIGRDYKNVYDDLKALESYGLINFIRVGKNQRPISTIKNFCVFFE